MSEISAERVEPTARVPDRISNETGRDPPSRPRRLTPEKGPSEVIEDSGTGIHELDSLA